MGHGFFGRNASTNAESTPYLNPCQIRVIRVLSKIKILKSLIHARRALQEFLIQLNMAAIQRNLPTIDEYMNNL